MDQDELYRNREQSLVKHFVLQKYLQRFAHIIFFNYESITYVDCFSGPWNVQSPDLKDSSFAIALSELRKARRTHEVSGRSRRCRCYFLEKDANAFRVLDQYANSIKDTEIKTRNATLAESIDDIVRYVRSDPQTFPFIFIDPTGWTGFEIDTIEPLLQLQPAEVLINFMTSHIRRFIHWNSPPNAESFERMYGRKGILEELQNVSDSEREDAAVQKYCKMIAEVGKYPYVCRAIVLHPTIDQTHFHLIYATRHFRGVEVFKKAEKDSISLQANTRAEARERQRVATTRQPSLFSAEVMDDPQFVRTLIDRYLKIAKQKLISILKCQQHLPYDELITEILIEPIVQETDVREWLKAWQNEGVIDVEGMKFRQRVPQKHNTVVTLKPARL